MPPLRLGITGQLKDDAQAYADRYGIALADAVRILLRKGLEAEAPPPAYADAFLDDPGRLGVRRQRPARYPAPAGEELTPGEVARLAETREWLSPGDRVLRLPGDTPREPSPAPCPGCVSPDSRHADWCYLS